MKLTPTQIDEIKAFISKRGFKQVDLQMEILDHVACKVEEKLATRPDMGFEKALAQTHAEFGVFGFSTVEDAMRSALSRQYWNLALGELKTWFSFPRIFLVLGYGLLAFYTFMFFDTVVLLVATMIACLVAWFTVVWASYKMAKRHGSARTMAAEQASVSMLSLTLLLQVFLQFSRVMDQSFLWAVAYTLLVLVLIFAFRSAVVIQKQVEKRHVELFAKYA